MPKKFTYDAVVKIFSNKKCTFVLSEDEFKKLPNDINKLKFNFTASCGHDSSAHFTNFNHKNTGVICRKCSYKNTGIKLKEEIKFSSEASNACIKEASGFKILEDIIKNDFDVLKTNEGCISDMIVKPKNIKEDKWLMIQLKTTMGLSHDIYSFKGFNKKYDDCIIICMSLNDQKIWVIEYDVVRHLKCKLSIGKKFCL